MAFQLLNAAVLFAVCVLIHALGTAVMLRRIGTVIPSPQDAGEGGAPLRRALLLAWTFIQVFFLHIVEMTVWALAFWTEGALATFEESLYFSIVSFTTVGYGDVLLAKPWRVFGAAEAATGNLLLGWSAGLMITIIQRIYREIVSANEAAPPA